MARILIVDDDFSVCDALARCVEHAGHQATFVNILNDSFDVLGDTPFDILFLDVRLPDGNGLESLPRFREEYPDMEVVIITGEADENDAELAIKAGAWDYVKKPLSIAEIRLQLTQVLHYQQERTARKTALSLKRDSLIGDSVAMKGCIDLLVQAASSDASVLVMGETGTGKEVFCRAIHDNSARASKPFVIVDCAALPATLLESVLFGHVKGAFTGAERTQLGLIKQANGGTLFLDEIGELPLTMQRAFLRVLQEHRFRPVGGSEEVHSDFRLVAATNRDLKEMAEEGHFRKDLLFRVQSHCIELPPLRERKDDISDLLQYHIEHLCKRRGLPPKTFSPDFQLALEEYDWPGNVRQLVSAIETAFAAAGEEEILFSKHLPVELRVTRSQQAIKNKTDEQDQAMAPTVAAPPISGDLPDFRTFRKAAIDEAEHAYMAALLQIVDHDLETACDHSGLSRSRIYQLLQKHNLTL